MPFLDCEMTQYGRHNHHLIFVYGTMMAKMINHGRITSGIVDAYGQSMTTSDCFTMRSRLSSQGVIVPTVHRTVERVDRARIVGEVYRIDGATLEVVDRAEGHPFVYVRELVEISGMTRPCWMYLFCGEDIDYLPVYNAPVMKYVSETVDGFGRRVHQYCPPRGSKESPE